MPRYSPTPFGTITAGPRPWIDVRAYGATGDGTTNDAAAIQAAIDAVPTTGGVVYLPAGVYKINTGLTCHDKENVHFVGEGATHATWQSAPTTGTVLKAGGAIVMLSLAAVANAQSVRGCSIQGICFNGDSTATTCLKLTSVIGSIFRDLHLRDATSVVLDCLTVNLTGVEDTQNDTFELITIVGIIGSTIGWRCDSWSDGQGNCAGFDASNFSIRHNNGVGLQLLDVDGCFFNRGHIQREGAGTGIGLELGASNHATSGHCRGNTFVSVQPGAGGVTARGSGFSQVSAANVILGYSLGNTSAGATIEPGARLAVLDWDGYTRGIREQGAKEVYLKDDFLAGNTPAGIGTFGELNWAVGASGTGATARLAAEVGHPGIYRLDTGATSASFAWISLGSSGAILLDADDFFDMNWVLRLNTNDANTTVRFGLGGPSGQFAVSNPPTDGLYFEKLAADTSWFAVTRNGAVQTRQEMLAVDTGWERFRIHRWSTTEVNFGMNDLEAGYHIMGGANVPTAGLFVWLQLTNTAAASKTVDVDRWDMLITGLAR